MKLMSNLRRILTEQLHQSNGKAKQTTGFLHREDIKPNHIRIDELSSMQKTPLQPIHSLKHSCHTMASMNCSFHFIDKLNYHEEEIQRCSHRHMNKNTVVPWVAKKITKLGYLYVQKQPILLENLNQISAPQASGRVRKWHILM